MDWRPAEHGVVALEDGLAVGTHGFWCESGGALGVKGVRDAGCGMRLGWMDGFAYLGSFVFCPPSREF